MRCAEYNKHLNHPPDISPSTAQQRLEDARSANIGAESWFFALLSCGRRVGTIGIIDGDHVDESNLQRQIILMAHRRS